MADPRFTFIGAGRLALGFARVLKNAGYAIEGVASRSPERARRAASILGCSAYASLEQAAQNADWLCIATQDDAIVPVVSRLAQQGALERVRLVLHLSGVLPASVLREAAGGEPSWVALALHPLASVPSEEAAVERLSRCWYGVDGDEAALAAARTLLERLGNRYLEVPADSRVLYHAGACVASNYLCTLAHMAIELLGAAGISRQDALAALLPLIAGTVQNLEQQGLPAALTGPVARGDVQTVRRHLRALSERAPRWLPAYRLLGLHTLELAPHRDLEAILKESGTNDA